MGVGWGRQMEIPHFVCIQGGKPLCWVTHSSWGLALGTAPAAAWHGLPRETADSAADCAGSWSAKWTSGKICTFCKI